MANPLKYIYLLVQLYQIIKHKLFSFILLAVIISSSRLSGQDNAIYLLVRADDIGSFHAANLGCIESFKNGIARSVELMPVCAWFPEAVKMINENSGLDVGIHLALTSEWSRIKWRPLTPCKTLIDKEGYFFPMVWKNTNFQPGNSIQESRWDISEIENELRAQIELVMKYVPNVSHLSAHMGFTSLDPRISSLFEKLALEYKLITENQQIKYFEGWGKNTKYEERIDKFCENLEKLTPGKYLFVEHPAIESTEMETVGHTGYANVAEDRAWVTRVFTSEKVKKTIEKKHIFLISYKSLKNKPK